MKVEITKAAFEALERLSNTGGFDDGTYTATPTGFIVNIDEKLLAHLHAIDDDLSAAILALAREASGWPSGTMIRGPEVRH